MNRLDKLQNNKRFQRLLALDEIVSKRNSDTQYISSLDVIINNYISKDLIRPKSLFEQDYHKNIK